MASTKRYATDNEARRVHNELARHLHQNVKGFEPLKELFRRPPISPRDLNNIKDITDLFQQLEKDEKISVGEYSFFTQRLRKIDPSQAAYVEEKETEICEILNRDSNINPVGADRFSQLMESCISGAAPDQTGSCTPSENTGAIAIPEITSGAVTNPTTDNQHSNINPVGADRFSQLMESCISGAAPDQTGSCTPSENTGAIAIPQITSGAVTNPTTVNQITFNYNDHREYKDEIKIETMKVRHAGNLSIGEQTVLPQGSPSDTEHSRSAASSSHAQEIHPDLVPMIEMTIQRIKIEKEKKFLETKAFHDAQKKLQTNRILVIKGNTGDGKTSIAFQLLHWLTTQQQARKPIRIHAIEKLDRISPDSNLVCIIDDIFGEKDLGRVDEQEWNKRLNVVETLFVNTNLLLITVRNEIFNALAKHSLGTVFTEENIIDLSTSDYNISDERLKLLEMYLPDKFSWTETEKDKIKSNSPAIGFPQCCQLFSNSPELQERRDKFFENPIHFFMDALSKSPECFAIVFLFLNDGMIEVNDLDPNGDKVDKTLLEQVFSIKFGGSEARGNMDDKLKIDLIRESLDKLLGYLVSNERQLFDFGETYRFEHDSIYSTVALLYAKKTLVGYIRHCPRKALRYITTAKSCTDKVFMSTDHYTYLCKRLLREFECETWSYGYIGSLEVWTDRSFVESFDCLLNERKVNKLHVLNQACRFGVLRFVLYLLRKGVQYDKNTPLLLLITAGLQCSENLDILKEIFIHLSNDAKSDIFETACRKSLVKEAEYLLREGVKPTDDTDWWKLITNGDEDDYGDVDVLEKFFMYIDDETKLHLFDRAHRSVSVECVLYLLREGVKPDKDINWWNLITHYDKDDDEEDMEFREGDVDILEEVFIHLDDETKVDLIDKAYRSASVDCVCYLLDEGVESKLVFDWWHLISNGYMSEMGDVIRLSQVDAYLNDEIRQDLFINYACYHGSIDCALYFLEKGVKPSTADLWHLIRQVDLHGESKTDALRTVFGFLDDEKKLELLNEACDFGSVDCVIFLLSKGVIPDKDKDWLELVTGEEGRVGGSLHVIQKLVANLNDEGTLDVLNAACAYGLVECAIYLLGEGVKPDSNTFVNVVGGGSMILYDTLLKYNVTPTAKYGNRNCNILHYACDVRKEEIVTELCNAYPFMAHEMMVDGMTPLCVAAYRGNCSLFQTVERTVLKSLCRVEDEKHKCETVECRLIHRSCVCSQYMSQLIDIEGRNVLHLSCKAGNSEVCVYLCKTYPALLTAVDHRGRHCLHYLAEHRQYDIFVECEGYVKQYMESIQQTYDITAIVDKKGKSLLDMVTVTDWLFDFEDFEEKFAFYNEGNPLYTYIEEQIASGSIT
ncbi:uncharacterized protein [Argopecten irradians]|uniref:uncharacterized protein isoform X2 n=1 Tax=Argopecten irradians TaxID=31199 RepID=UPI003721AC17